MTTDCERAADEWARSTVARTMAKQEQVQAEGAEANEQLARRGYPLPLPRRIALSGRWCHRCQVIVASRFHVCIPTSVAPLADTGRDCPE